MAAISVAATAAVVVIRLGWALRLHGRACRDRAPHLRRLRLPSGHSPADQPLWVRDDRPLAMSIGGRPGRIAMSDTLRRHLTPAAMATTLEHERAHLHGRHHALVTLADVLARALPAIPLLRTAPTAIRDLVELAADARAARRCGSAAVREALGQLTGHSAPTLGLAMASRLTETRLTVRTVGSSGAVVVGTPTRALAGHRVLAVNQRRARGGVPGSPPAAVSAP